MPKILFIVRGYLYLDNLRVGVQYYGASGYTYRGILRALIWTVRALGHSHRRSKIQWAVVHVAGKRIIICGKQEWFWHYSRDALRSGRKGEDSTTC